MSNSMLRSHLLKPFPAVTPASGLDSGHLGQTDRVIPVNNNTVLIRFGLSNFMTKLSM